MGKENGFTQTGGRRGDTEEETKERTIKIIEREEYVPDPAREKRIEMYEGISNVTAYTSLFSSPIIKTISEVVSFGTTVLANVERAIDGKKKYLKI